MMDRLHRLGRFLLSLPARVGRVAIALILGHLRLCRWLVTRKMFWFGIVVGLTWLGYHEFADRVTPRQDAALLGVMAFVLFECLIGTILSTEHWRLRVMGLIALLGASSLLYFVVFDGVYRWMPSISRRPEAIELARSLFLIATIALGFTYNRYLWRNRKNPPAWWRKDERYPGRRWWQDFFD